MVSVSLQIKPSLKTHKLNKLYFPCRVIDQLTETWSVKNKQKHQQKRLKEKTLKREIRVFIRQRPRSSHGLYTGIFFSVLPLRPDVNDVFGHQKRQVYFPKTVPRVEVFFLTCRLIFLVWTDETMMPVMKQRVPCKER